MSLMWIIERGCIRACRLSPGTSSSLSPPMSWELDFQLELASHWAVATVSVHWNCTSHSRVLSPGSDRVFSLFPLCLCGCVFLGQSVLVGSAGLRSNGWYFPNVVFGPLKDSLETTLFVNAWDPYSIVGNGNAGDQSLDGFFGRSTAMGLMSWPGTNPCMSYRAVDQPN